MSDPYSTGSVAPSQGEDEHWEEIAKAIDALAAAWDEHLAAGSGEPELATFVPEGDGELRRLALIELIKVDLEYRWQKNVAPRKVEAYVELFPEFGSMNQLPVELIHEELHARMQAGDAVSEDEIHERFPRQAGALCELVGGMAVSGTPTCTYYADTQKKTQIATDVKPFGESHLKYGPGDTVDDFQLLTELGRGAFAQVFLARQVSMERMVALKISAQQGSEPQTLAQLDHTNIVRVFDQRASGDPPVRLLYMEVVPGGTLLPVARRVRETEGLARDGRLLLDLVDEKLGASGVGRPENSPSRHWLAEAPWPMVVCQIGAQLAEGLAYAHEKGVMHRDIKPANVLLTPEGAPKLADFNVSYNGGRADESPEDTFGGSLGYMSPEQLRACHPVLGGSPQLVREASDVYSLGVLLWELLCGRRPFDDEPKSTGGELARLQRMVDCRHYADFGQICQQLPKDCPESLKQVLLRCLQPRKDERYSSAEEVARALRLCLEPRCWKLLQEPTNLLARLPLRFPLVALVIAMLTPNALAGFFNLTYNRQRISELSQPIIDRFETVQLWINGIVFPLGVIVALWVAVRVRRLLDHDDRKEAEIGSGRVLFFGLLVSLVSLALWTVSGIIFPITVNLGLELPDPVGFYSHFFMSLLLCGIVAMAYPYFLLTALATRCFVPALVRNGVVAGPRWKHLQQLRRLNKIHLALTALVPMLAGLLWAWVGIDPNQKWALMIASGGGFVGFIAMFLLEQTIDRNLDALEKIAVEAPRRM